jgi:type I restriction enzyme S subunit
VSWGYKRLSDICEIKLGKTPSRSDKSYWDDEKSGSNIWVSIADLSKLSTRFITDSKEYISDKGASLFKPVKAGTLLMSFKLSIGKLAYANCDLYTNEAIVALPIKDPKQIDSDFLYYFLMFYDWDKETENDEKLKGKTLNKAKLNEIQIPLPSLPTQQKIVAKLDAIFAEIDKAQAAVEANAKNAELLVKGTITSLIGKFSEDYFVKFGGICGFVRGPFGGSLKKSIFVDSGYAVYEQQHPINNQFDSFRYFISDEKFDEMKRFEVFPHDLLMSCSGVTLGKIAIVPKDAPKGIINQALLKITPKEVVRKDYLKVVMESDYFQSILWDVSGGAAQPNVPSVKVIKDFLIPVPTIKEQDEFIEIVSSIHSYNLSNVCKEKKKSLVILKQAILKKAFNGELVKE